ncbi:pilus assembly protein TadG-related protein [Actimicrobium sp. CCI2.3]|uniref:pilus assembly protein TadG-related protein n=1 Tax=Actimicrobium sp. CCI2.3 TaxID=3048616 RepID=UPI002AB4F528|nr:pilus assembly protein TadG-related protein [Actimicrobium sp. CCI2.3]MDY7574990.1 pilus assembly protein TadG-related protein [Actimicrobium sp. CCI2.3]MEB0021439.1 pilus assembly protein TadG-related protein [Actimicrobium sp. CCI2.3]
MHRGSQFQRGQALIYGIFVLMGGLTALFFLFNTGQLSSEKTKLVNTADAVAYSAGVMQARALNFDAYSNRALVANEVLVAQMVSLSSWGQYVSTHADNLTREFPDCRNPVIAIPAALYNYDLLYGIFCFATTSFGVGAIDLAGRTVTTGAAAVIIPVEASKRAILSSQALLHAPAYLQNASLRVMQEVADRNYAGDGAVTVAAFTGLPSGASPAATDVLNGFTTQYADAARLRFAEVAKLAAYSDDFVRERNWTSEALVSPPHEWKCVWRNKKNSVKRRGGTELINLDEWKAEDTESSWRFTNGGGLLNTRCNLTEHPIGYGEQQARPSEMDQDESGAQLGGSPGTNPRASGAASSSAWTAYTGLPSFYDLSDLDPTRNPVMQFRVRLTRSAAGTRTSAGTSAIASTPRLNNFQNNFADGVMTAVAGGEVFFERPLTVPNDPSQGNDNQYAAKTGSPDRREIGSLFNPYWQVRLMQKVSPP